MSLLGAGVFGDDSQQAGTEMTNLTKSTAKAEKAEPSRNLISKSNERVPLNFVFCVSAITILAPHTLTQPRIHVSVAPASSTLKDGRKKRARNRTIFEWSSEKISNPGKEKIVFRKSIDKSLTLTEEQVNSHYIFFELHDESLPANKQMCGSAALNVAKTANSTVRQDFVILGESSENRQKNVIATMIAEVFVQQLTEFRIEFVNWSGHALLAADDTGTSDPFVVFSISKDWKKIHRKGGYFGRSCSSPKVMNTLYPFWKECGHISFFGTRSELEMEELHINVFDWDLTTNDHIGFAKIPVHAFLERGYIDIPLKITEPLPGGSPSDIGKPAGKLSGTVRLTGSKYNQMVDRNLIIPGYRYLFVKILSATNLPANTKNGFTDCFVVIEYEKIKQQTSVQYRNLNPTFNETFSFPVILDEDTPKGLAKKGNVIASCYDKDGQENNYLGNFQIPIKEIFESSVVKINGNETRTFDRDVLMMKLGEETKTLFRVQAWFSPDFPPDFRIDPNDISTRKSELKEWHSIRLQTWRNMLQHNVDQTTLGFPISAIDEEGIEHFMPSYISPMAAPRDIQSPEQIMRMVHSITFETDKSSFEIKDDVWMTPSRFLDMKKGDSEEHAILMVNLLLGIGYDAYCCVGKTKKGYPHAWVLIREANGTVSFWETTNGKYYRMEQRWKGTKAGDSVIGVNLPDVDHLEKSLKKSAKKNIAENDDMEFLFSDSEDTVTREEIIKHNEGIIETRQGAALSYYHSLEPSKNILPYGTLEVIFNNHNIWGNAQNLNPEHSKYDVEDKEAWIPFVESGDDQVRPFYDIVRLPPKLSALRITEMQRSIVADLKSRISQERLYANLQTTFVVEFEPVLERGLQICEEKANGIDNHLEYLSWQGQVSSLVLPGFEFKGVPISFSFTDSAKIADELMKRTELHKDSHKECKLALAAYVVAHHNAICNVWVYIARMSKSHKKTDADGEQETHTEEPSN